MRTRTYKETYYALIRLLPHNSSWGWYIALLIGLAALPLVARPFVVGYLTTILIAATGAVGLNLLTGTTGLISLGHGGFLALGAYTAAILVTTLGWGLTPALIASGAVASVFSLVVGIASLRLKGLYLAITTLAFTIITTHLIVEADTLTNGSVGLAVRRPDFLGVSMRGAAAMYYLSLAVGLVTVLGALNLLRCRVGRAWNAIRDYDIAAGLMGINLVRYKLLAFAVSSFITGVAGALLALHLQYVNIDDFTLAVSVEAIAMIIVGGLGSVRGAILGAILVTIMPDVGRMILEALGGAFGRLSGSNMLEIKGVIYGLTIMVFLRFEPDGMNARWMRIKRFWSTWPLAKRAA